jgi:hypothetical protein
LIFAPIKIFSQPANLPQSVDMEAKPEELTVLHTFVSGTATGHFKGLDPFDGIL